VALAHELPDLVPVSRLPPLPIAAALVVTSAAWGIVVDGPIIPVLAPSGNSTLWQATTAAAFALLGILYGPVLGALGGLVRDGTSTVITLALHPHHFTDGQWLGRAAVDIFEDVVLGLGPGLARLWTRRVAVLTLAAGAAAWLSLPFLLAADALIDGRPSRVVAALTTITGNWDQPVDPGLTVYALFTAAFVALALARWTTRPARTLLLGGVFLSAALILVGLGAHA
jgi:hypothetical protein